MSIIEYQWGPLDTGRKEIRVLDLVSGAGDTPLVGRLRHAFLDESEKPAYETISYAWGDTALVDNISVDGETIPIPASAGSALRRMRSPDRTRAFWIDCICIAQHDAREKGHQVGLMADIFQNSMGTLAHLGDDDGDTAERAFHGFKVIYKAWIDAVDAEQAAEGFTEKIGSIEDIEIQNWSSLRETIDLVAMRDVLLKPYFR